MSDEAAAFLRAIAAAFATSAAVAGRSSRRRLRHRLQRATNSGSAPLASSLAKQSDTSSWAAFTRVVSAEVETRRKPSSPPAVPWWSPG